MSLQKKNDLLRSHAVVLIFWFIVLFFVSAGFDLRLLAGSMVYAVLVVFGGVVCGVSIWFSVNMLRKDGALARNSGYSVRGARVTIGEPPVATQPARKEPSDSVLEKRFPWWRSYSKAHPMHADAFRAVLGVMSVEPRLPASPVPGGHGGATLIQHSFNVVDTMMEMAPKWSYRGHKNKRGEISFPLLDNTKIEYRFPSGDPIIQLAAFAHDIGKVTCYRLEPDGRVREVRRNHDIEGAKLMRALPEVMALPWKDRMALLTSCEFYHHIGSLPYSPWIDDRARALVELLIAADIATGQREGGVIVGEYEDADVILAQSQDSEKRSDDGVGEILPNKSAEAPQSSRPSPANAGEHGTALDLAYSVLLEPGRVNGANAATRVAWKHGEWLYISDAKLRAAVAAATGDSGYNMLPHRGNMHAFTLELMAQLAAAGFLLQEHKGRKFSEKRALYTTASSVPGKTAVESKFVMVANVKAFPGLENAADCKAAPQIVGCSWGDSAAINKSGAVAVANNGSETDEAMEADIPVSVVDEEEVLLKAATEMRLPFVEKVIDGEEFLFFEEEIVKLEFPDFRLEGRFIKKTGGKSGKNFVGVKKA